jgi:hypothetical protein
MPRETPKHELYCRVKVPATGQTFDVWTNYIHVSSPTTSFKRDQTWQTSEGHPVDPSSEDNFTIYFEEDGEAAEAVRLK